MLNHTALMGLKAMSIALLLAFAGQAVAEAGYAIARVNSVLMNGDDTYGGCMAQLSVNPAAVLGGCSGWWVTFSCSGDFADRVRAYRMVDVAQLAFATGNEVVVYFRDDMKHNGYCYAYRIDVSK